MWVLSFAEEPCYVFCCKINGELACLWSISIDILEVFFFLISLSIGRGDTRGVAVCCSLECSYVCLFAQHQQLSCQPCTPDLTVYSNYPDRTCLHMGGRNEELKVREGGGGGRAKQWAAR